MLSEPSKSSLNPKRRPDEMKVKGYFYRPEGLQIEATARSGVSAWVFV